MLQATSVTTTPSLSALPGWAVLIAIAAIVLLSGVVVIVGRHWLGSHDSNSASGQSPGASSDGDSTIVRSWIAIALVGGLLVFCAAALSLGDSTLRSTLFGGLIASVGAAVAFYFSSKTAEQARQDIMSVAQTTTDVPSLNGLQVSDAQATMAKTPLQLVINGSGTPQDVVENQSPVAGTSIRSGSTVTVDRKAPG